MRHPPSPDEIERQRQQAMSTLQVSWKTRGDRDAVFERLVYGFHPYGLPQKRPPRRSPRSADDLLAFHQRNFGPETTRFWPSWARCHY